MDSDDECSTLDNFPPRVCEINHEFMYKKGLCGLKNLGNTCFMNSILQCLNSTPGLIKFIFSNEFYEHLNKNKLEYSLIAEWKKVSRFLWYKNATYIPMDFVRTLQRISMAKDNPQFTGFGQNDSQEFLQFMLECLHNCLSRNVEIETVGEPTTDYDRMAHAACVEFKQFFENDYSKIIDLFYGQFYSNVETITEGKTEESQTFNPFNMLSVEIPEGASEIYECLDSFTKNETILDEDDKKIYKKVRFWTLPAILIIFMKRYNNDGEKIKTHINFPVDELDMSKYVCGYNKGSYKYSLQSISNHSGGLMGGHHWSYIKNADSKWYKYNDHIVSTIAQGAIVSSDAYCLFYVRN